MASSARRRQATSASCMRPSSSWSAVSWRTKRAGATAVDLGAELERVAQPLAPDAEAVEVGDDAGLLGPLGRLGHRSVPGLDQVGQRNDGRHPGGHGTAGRALLRHGGQALGQALPADRVERVEHVGPGLFALAFEQRGELDPADRDRLAGGAAESPAVLGRPCRRGPRSGRRGRGPRPGRRPSQPSSSRKVWARTGSTSAKRSRAARRRRVATRMSWSSSMSSPRRVPGSFSRKTPSWRRSTA